MFGRKKEQQKQEPTIDSTTDYTTLDQKVNDISVERGETLASSSKKATSKIRILFISVGILIALAMLVISILSFKTKDETAVVQQDLIANTAPKANFSEEMNRLLSEQRQQMVQNQQKPEPKEEQEPPSTTVEALPATTPETPSIDENEVRRLSGNVLIDLTSKSKEASQDQPRAETETGSPLNDKMTRTVTPSVIAQKRTDLTYLLRKGTTIACTLHSKIITTQPGFARCIVNKDVYSADGKVLLIERGSEVIGEQTAGLTQGQARIFIMWNTVETPKGVRIEIGSPSSDALGAAGQEAQVDTHFWERFGGAIMLSMIDDVMGIASNRVDNKDYRFENTQENVQNMAEEALRNTINIPPTGYVNQGALLNIIVVRDVDFRNVYELVYVR
ncbi:type IV secretion system protein VirB10 [Pelistega sp. MC2]|uniref:type IV secretion system protein VirB10 n=1 Tax=Pelistega sp. MC2 TaxID=1720297 RepID=UPI0008DADF04|nr:type IV secretion system protein VirB10 [Pelistega sp. MC2]